MLLFFLFAVFANVKNVEMSGAVWVVEAWSSCESDCTHTRYVYCEKRGPGEVEEYPTYEECIRDSGPKPEETGTCYDHPNCVTTTAPGPVIIPSLTLTITKSPDSLEDVLRLDCKSSEDNLLTTWYKNDQPVDDNDETITVQDASLIINKKATSDGNLGVYKCDNSISAASLKIVLKEDLSARIVADSMSFKTDDRIRLECKTTGNGDVTWYKNGIKLQPDNRILVSKQFLEIGSSTPRDSSMYKCQISNGAKSVESSVNVTVVEPPPLEKPCPTANSWDFDQCFCKDCF